MPITSSCQLISISEIWVNRAERQRRNIEAKDLEISIQRNGLLNPIIITRAEGPMGELFELKAGERRLTACRNLGHTEILCHFAEDLTQIEAQLIELEENIKRTDLEWRETTTAVGRIHPLHLGLDPDWPMGETAEVCGLGLPTISKYLQMEQAISNGHQRVAEAGTIPEAYNVIKRAEARAAGDALEELMELPGTSPVPGARARPNGPPSPEATILQESFLVWGPAYHGPRFNLIHCDFPYGIEAFSGPQGRGAEPGCHYSDQKEVFFELLDCLCSNLDRLMSLSGHLMFWYSGQHLGQILETFRLKAPSLHFHSHPLIWVKSDNAGIAADPRRTPRHVYETCLFASRGDRQLVQVKADAYSAPTDPRLHPSTKPEPMLRHFMTMLIDGHSLVLDPTCGSGASLRAAESLGAAQVLGLEIDPEYVGPARRALASARVLRAASGDL